MVRTLLQCDICGNTWDITFTDYNTAISPEYTYVRQCIKDEKRKYIIKTGTYTDDGRIETDEVDICDNCYNKLNNLIMNIKCESKVE